MSNNTSSANSEVTKLLDSVRSDTPDLSLDELRTLIAKSEVYPHSRSVQRSSSQRKIKRVTVMSSLGIILLGVLQLLPSSKQEPSFVKSKSTLVDKTASTEAMSNRAPTSTKTLKPFEVTSRVQSVQSRPDDVTKPGKGSGIVDPKRWRALMRKPVDVEIFKPIEINSDKFVPLGLVQKDGGEVIYYHLSNKIGFPVSDKTFSYADVMSDPLRTVLGNRPFYAEYVTDSRGNLMMHYKTHPVGNGNSVSLGFFDMDVPAEINRSDYYGARLTMTNPIFSDRTKDTLAIGLVIKAGIMQIDTVLGGKHSQYTELMQRQALVEAECVRRDSTLKVGLGGMAAIAKNYSFSFADSTAPLVVKVLKAYKAINRAGMTDEQVLGAEYSAVSNLLESEKTTEGKLRLEQLTIKLSYEMALAEREIESAELQNPVDLIPVLVRQRTGLKTNDAFDNGLVFWYRNSDSLQAVLNTFVASVTLNDPKLSFSVTPNPARLQLNIQYTVAEPSPLRITLADITGKHVYTETWSSGGGTGAKEINVQSLASGIYVLILDSDKGRIARQVVIQHR